MAFTDQQRPPAARRMRPVGTALDRRDVAKLEALAAEWAGGAVSVREVARALILESLERRGLKTVTDGRPRRGRVQSDV
jgi:hypothetical protein